MINAIAWSLFWLGIAALLGFIIAWFLRGSAFESLEAQVSEANDKVRERDAAFKKAQNQLSDKENQLKATGAKIDKLKEEISISEKSLTETENMNRSLKGDLSNKEKEVAGLKETEISFNELLPKFEHNTAIARQLEADLESIGSDRDSWKSKFEALGKENEAFKLDNADMVNKFTAVKEDLDATKAENARLKKQVEKAQNSANNELDKLKASLAQAESAKNAAVSESAGFKNDVSNLKGEISGFDAKVSGYDAKIVELETAKVSADSVANDFKAKWEGLQSANGKMLQDIETLKAQLANSKSSADDIAKLKAELETANASLTSTKTELDESNNKFSTKSTALFSEIETLKAQLASNSVSNTEIDKLKAELEKANSDCNGKCDALEDEIKTLKAELEEANKEAEVISDEDLFAEVFEIEEMPSAEEISATIDRVKKSSELIDFARIGNKDSMISDDLKRIKGIGEFTEKKLHAASINTFRQVAKFNDSDEETIEEVIEFFPGRVRRYDWVGQAKEILGIKLTKQEEELSRVKRKAGAIDFNVIGYATSRDKDDLKLIKGIGSFIEVKLNALGIFKFSQIGKFTENIDDIVNKAIEFFPGRIKRDDWKGQAKVLAESSKT